MDSLFIFTHRLHLVSATAVGIEKGQLISYLLSCYTKGVLPNEKISSTDRRYGHCHKNRP